jgi:hypothetical protein
MLRILGIAAPAAAGRGSDPFDAASFGGDVTPGFAVGYDSGTGMNVLAFTVDVSIVTDGTSGDIVTG